QTRYNAYQKRITEALLSIKSANDGEFDVDSVARQLIALIDGLWLEYCLNAEGFTLRDARYDCYLFLKQFGVDLLN
ncbi:MAG: TetR family transcriptional regulator C-terminal domain-containing protein, partial [Pseudomonadota bacterium]